MLIKGKADYVIQLIDQIHKYEQEYGPIEYLILTKKEYDILQKELEGSLQLTGKFYPERFNGIPFIVV